MTTCEKCDRPAEYGPGDSKPLTLIYRAVDGPVVTEAFQPAGRRCEECAALEAAKACDRLADRERLRAAYRLERERRADSGSLICAECRVPVQEFLVVRERVICQVCTYTQM